MNSNNIACLVVALHSLPNSSSLRFPFSDKGSPTSLTGISSQLLSFIVPNATVGKIASAFGSFLCVFEDRQR